MARAAATLETELNALTLYDNSADAAEAWAEAFTVYFEGAATSISSVPVTVGALRSGPKAALKAALLTIGPGTAAAQLAAGIAAFWALIIATPATYFAGFVVPAVPPAGIAALTAALQAVFAANIAASKSKADCSAAIASAIHTANIGGTITWPGPPPVVEIIL